MVRCKYGHSFSQTLDAAKEQWCKKCDNKLKHIKNYASSNNGKVLNKIYERTIAFQCHIGHKWTISARNAKKNWCRQCEKEEKNKLRQELEEEHRRQQIQQEEEQKKLFEQARGRTESCFQSSPAAKSQTHSSKSSVIQHFEQIEREILRVAIKKTSEYIASKGGHADCSKEQILQVYSVFITPEEILYNYM